MPSRLHVASTRGLLAAALLALAVSGVGPLAHPAPVSAGTAETMEATLLSLVNGERAKRSLRPLRLHSGLVALTQDRADSMASTGAMKHPSCLGCLLQARNIQYYGVAEVIAATTYKWGDEAARSIFNGWKGSPAHWAILMSSKYNYVGFGVALRTSNGTTFAAGITSESNDRTGGWVRITGASRSGSTVSWSWTGGDIALQTHTAWLKNFDVQYRVDGGTWSTIRSGTTGKSLSLTSRAGGHCYSIRVRSRDNRWNLSAYTAESRICLA
jgi:uncharacterized protein YkwD